MLLSSFENFLKLTETHPLIDLEFYKQNCPDPNLLLDLV